MKRFLLWINFCCCIYISLQAANEESVLIAPFNQQTAQTFLEHSPNLKDAAAASLEQALNAYESSDIKAAAPLFFAAKYFAFLAKYGSGFPEDLKIYLLSQPELLEEFFSILSDKDDAKRVFEIIGILWKTDADAFRTTPRLALAIAIVFDTQPPDYWPHSQVNKEALPRTFAPPEEAFKTWLAQRARGRLLIQLDRLSIEELKYLVSTLCTNADRDWVAQSVSVNLANIEKLYTSINYDAARMYTGQSDWLGRDYHLETIKEKGGICTDQAYFTTEIAKIKGAPAFILSGSGLYGFHAWAAYMQKPGQWNFDVGRYEQDRFITGKTLDPQTWEPASNHSLQCLREGFRRTEKYRLNEIHTLFARYYFKQADYVRAEKSARTALEQDSRNEETWDILIAALQKRGATEKVMVLALEDAIKSFFKYPDSDAKFRKMLIKYYRDKGETSAARKLTTSIILKTKSTRPDIAMEFASSELEMEIHGGSDDDLYAAYKRLLNVFKVDGTVAFEKITIPLINTLLALKKFNQTDTVMEITQKILKPEKSPNFSLNFERLQTHIAEARKAQSN